MCGIVYSLNFQGRPVVPTILKRYKDQRTRGTDGFGFYIPETNRLTHNVRESRILSLLRREKTASEVLMHHRFPTSTANVRNACHPFSTKDHFENNYVVVHNGVVHNTFVLHEQHQKMGIDYVSKQDNGRFNDSEALAYDIALYLEGMVDKLTASGSIAFIAIKRDKNGKPVTLFFGRNGSSPLKMKMTDNSLTLSSEGEGIDVEINKLHSYSYDTGEIIKRALDIPGGWVSRPNQYSRPIGSTASTIHSTSGLPASVPKRNSTYSTEADRVRNAISCSSMANGWDNDDELKVIQQRWEEETDTENMKDSLMAEANNDEGIALAIGENTLRLYKKRMIEIEDAEEDTEIMSETQRLDIINEYCEIEEKQRSLSLALKQIRTQLVDAAEARILNDRQPKGVSGEHRIGFHQTITADSAPKTGEKHVVPTINYKQTRLLASRDIKRYAD